MRKELPIAIVIGLIFGLIIGFGIWRANAAINNDPLTTEATDTEIENKAQAVTEDERTTASGISVTSPQELDVISTTPTKVIGLATANSNVVISSENKDYLVKTGSTGAFEAEVELVKGVNQIIVQEDSLDKEGQTVTVIFTDEFEN